MQEIKKQPDIVIASVLKPVDDTRMLEKMGRSLIEKNQGHVHLIGFGSDGPPDKKNLSFHPLGRFRRISLARVLAPFRVFQKLLVIRSKIVIINTHELLFVAVVYRILYGAKIYYDIRENYFLNILNTNSFPAWISPLVAFYVRYKEWVTSPFINHYLLAEACYVHELGFIGKHYSVVENKCRLPDGFVRVPQSGKIKLLFSGTLDASTGIFESIDLVKKLHSLSSLISLTIIGYCALPPIQKKIMDCIEGCTYISVIGLTDLVPHHRIFGEIATATAGLVFYPLSPHNQNCIPTKLYEYLACRLPVLYDYGASWAHIPEVANAGIGIDFYQPDVSKILKVLQEERFYPSQQKVDATWSSEEKKFLKAIHSS